MARRAERRPLQRRVAGDGVAPFAIVFEPGLFHQGVGVLQVWHGMVRPKPGKRAMGLTVAGKRATRLVLGVIEIPVPQGGYGFAWGPLHLRRIQEPEVVYGTVGPVFHVMAFRAESVHPFLQMEYVEAREGAVVFGDPLFRARDMALPATGNRRHIRTRVKIDVDRSRLPVWCLNPPVAAHV